MIGYSINTVESAAAIVSMGNAPTGSALEMLQICPTCQAVRFAKGERERRASEGKEMT